MERSMSEKKKSKFLLIAIIFMIVLMIAKPLYWYVGSSTKTTNVSLLFYETSIYYERMFDELKEKKYIKDYRYDNKDKTVVVVSAYEKEMNSCLEYFDTKIDEELASYSADYSIEVNDLRDNIVVSEDGSSDFFEVYRSTMDITGLCQFYQLFSGKSSWSCHLVIKNSSTGKVISESIQPNNGIEYDAQSWTGIDDEERAAEVFNSNLYRQIRYEESYMDEDRFVSPGGEFSFEMPANAKYDSKDKLDSYNGLEQAHTITDVKSKLLTGDGFREALVEFDDGLTCNVFVNYSAGKYDEESYDSFIKTSVFQMFKSKDDLKKVKLEKASFLGKDCNVITYQTGDRYVYALFYYSNGLSYDISGNYADESQLNEFKEFLGSFEATEK